MANLTASALYNLTFTGPDSEPDSIPPQSVASPYGALNEGIIDVTDGTAAATVFAVPFGGITVDATAGYIKNLTGQDLNVKINGAASASHSIPSGGIHVWANEGVAATPITQFSLTTTGVQSGDGQIIYRLFGDPA